MITENRLKHMLGVARKAKEYAASLRPNDNQFMEDMFLLGLLHDMGYEFLENNSSHAMVGGKILKRNNYRYWQEVSLHGDATVENMSDELFVLNSADMTTGPNGEDFSFEERLAEIKARFGADSNALTKCTIEVKKLKADKRYAKISQK